MLLSTRPACLAVVFLSAIFLSSSVKAQFQGIASINSPEIEYAPSISANGKTLIFQSNRDGRYKLYLSHQSQANVWSAPEPIDAINNFGDESDLIGGPSISYDGNFIFFFATFNGGIGQEDLWYSERTATGWGSPVNLGNIVNSKGYDGFPSISSDGKSLYFMRLNETISNGFNCYTLMVAEKDDQGAWGRPKPLPKTINLNCEKCPRIMPDNETLLFASIREGSIKGSFDMYESKWLPSGKWGEPKPLTFLNSEGNEFFGSVSAEGDLIYFNAKGAQNEDILFTSIPQDLRPSRVFTLEGKTLTAEGGTPLQAMVSVQLGAKKIAELPSNPSDGNFTLVLKEGDYNITFARAGYRAKSITLSVNAAKDNIVARLPVLQTTLQLSAINAVTKSPVVPEVVVKPDGDQKPAVILKEGKVEVSPIVFGANYLVAVTAEGYEAQEFSVSLSPTDSTAIVKEIGLKPLPPRLTLAVVDAETQKLMPSIVRVMDLTNKKYLHNGPLNDTLKADLTFNGLYKIISKAPNYLFAEESIDLTQPQASSEIVITLALSPLKVGAKLQLKEIFFEVNSAEIAPESFAELKEVFDFLGGNKNLVIEISAHTDDLGTHASNQELSDKRAQSVVDFLKEKGVPEAMMVAKGYGETQPMVPNTSEENKAKNRRVEFKVMAIK